MLALSKHYRGGAQVVSGLLDYSIAAIEKIGRMLTGRAVSQTFWD
jgi:hypothetical protein